MEKLTTPTKSQILKVLKDHTPDDGDEQRFAIYINKKRIIPLFFHSVSNAIDWMYSANFKKDGAKTRKLIEEMVKDKIIQVKLVK